MESTPVEPITPTPSPPPPQPVSLAYTALSEVQLSQINNTEDVQSKIDLMASYIGVTSYKSNSRIAIMVDFYYYNIMFCQENSFTDEQTSTFFAIMKLVFEFSVEESNNHDDAFSKFKALVLQHNFSVNDVKKIIQYVSRTFFRNLKAYQYVFKTPQELLGEVREVVVETGMSCLPLGEATEVSDLVIS